MAWGGQWKNNAPFTFADTVTGVRLLGYLFVDNTPSLPRGRDLLILVTFGPFLGLNQAKLFFICWPFLIRIQHLPCTSVLSEWARCWFWRPCDLCSCTTTGLNFQISKHGTAVLEVGDVCCMHIHATGGGKKSRRDTKGDVLLIVTKYGYTYFNTLWTLIWCNVYVLQCQQWREKKALCEVFYHLTKFSSFKIPKNYLQPILHCTGGVLS